MPDVDDQIDRLYQLPLEEFTAARNALAKEAKRPTIKDLEKPNIAAWAVNQLYWRHRAVYDRLVKAAEQQRAEHRKLLAGKSSDIRDAEKAHRDAVRDASDHIKSLLKEGGHAASDQTLNAVQETLESLPSSDQPGRLTRPLKPLGFEALSGVSIKPALRVVKPPADAGRSGSSRDGGSSASSEPRMSAAEERALARQHEKEERERKERQREAQMALKTAEAAMLRAEDAVKKAEKALGELRAKRDEAVSEYQRARLRAHE
jgi:hypothetical protein